jgi:hypothetical protein
LAVLWWAALCGAARAQAPDPFAPNLRWKHAAASGASWIPSSVDFAAGGEIVWAAGVGASPRAMLFASGASSAVGSDTAPVVEDAGLLASSGAILARGSSDEHALFLVAQYPQADAQHRRTEVACYDALGAPFAPQWRHSLALIGNGAARLVAARNGGQVVAAAHDSASSTLEIQRIEALHGAALASFTLTSQSLRELAASADVSRIAVVAGAHVWVFDGAGATLYSQDLGLATNALACSGDGHGVAFGYGARVRVVADNSGAFQVTHDYLGAFGEVPIKVALSDDGATLAIAWWNQVTGTAIHFQIWNSGVLTFELFQSSVAGGLQNYPSAAALTHDGARALFAAWGSGDAAADLWLVDANTGAQILTRDLGGSALSAALDDTGTRVAVGVKDVHANQFGAGGDVRLYDTGERDCQILGAPSLAHGLHLAARRPGASQAFFVLGRRLAAPVPFGSSLEPLAVERTHGAHVYARAADLAGRADLQVALPLGSLGLDFAAQAAFRVPGSLELTATTVDLVLF